MTDIRQVKEYAKYLESSGWKVGTVDGIFIYLKKIPVLGWFAKIQRPSVLNSKIINFVELKYHPFQFSIEPDNNKSKTLLLNHNFKLSNSPSLPTKTIQIDLTKTKEKLLKEMYSKTRYNIGLAKRKGLEIGESNEIEKFAKLKGNFFSQKKNIIKLNEAFDKNTHLFCAYKNNKLLAGILLLTTKDTAYYMHAASTKEGNKLFAPTLLTWHTIQFAKKKGFKVYDFDGIYDERFPIKSWLGFTRFKKRFGGQETEYPGCFTKTIFNLSYLFH